jgi:hypothetical protein
MFRGFTLGRRRAQQYSKTTMFDATGKTWDEWQAILDLQKSRKQTHASNMRYLMHEHHLSPAWARTIASYYQLRS